MPSGLLGVAYRKAIRAETLTFYLFMLGLYDSGIGGLLILDQIKKQNQSLDIIYLADNKYLPLGERSLDEIQKIVQEGVEKLFDLGCNLVVLACNTATVNTIRYLQQVWLPKSKWAKTHQVLGISQPLLEILESKKTSLAHRNGLILATPATYKSGFYQSEAKQRGYDRLFALPCSGLAEVIETFDSNQILSTLKSLFKSARIDIENLDYVVLACTHYAWAKDQILELFPKQVEIINPNHEIASKLDLYLQKHPQYQSLSSTLKFYYTKDDSTYKYSQILKSQLGFNNLFEL